MTANTNNLSANIDFRSYKNDLIAFASSNAVFTDYNFQGGNMSVLLDILSYNTTRNALLANFIYSEADLDSAQLRSSLVSKSKELNYLPRSRISASTTVSIQIYPTGNPASLVIPANYSVLSKDINSNAFMFSTNSAITVINNANNYIANNVIIYEGQILTEYFYAGSNTYQYFPLASANVDTSSIFVNIQNSNTDTTNTNFYVTDSLFGLSRSSNVFFLQGYKDNFYSICFGDGNFGTALVPGNVIKVTYRNTFGDDGNGFYNFSPIGSIAGYNSVSINNIGGFTSGGAERENNESIRKFAPLSYASQKNIVDNNDYINYIRENFPTIQTVNAISGENLPQKQYGTVAICVKPFSSLYATNTLKSQIISSIQTKNTVTVTPIIIDPDYYFLGVNSNVYYSLKNTSYGTSDIQSLVINNLIAYSNASLSDFNNNFYYTNLLAQIDNSDVSIINNDTSVLIIKRLSPILNQIYNITINFNNQLFSQNSSVKLPSNYTATISSSGFYYSIDGINTYFSYIQDDGMGNLYVYTINNINQQVILNSNIGTVNYITGLVNISNFFTSNYNGYISLYAKTANKDFMVFANQMIQIEPTDLNISVYGKT